jgi:hypothetical protein
MFRPVTAPTTNSLLRYSQITPQATRMESMKATWDLSVPRTLGGSIMEYMSAPSKSEGEMLGAEQANALYPDIEMPFTGPVSTAFAAHVANRQAYKRSMESIVGMGPDDFRQTLLNLGVGMGASMTDPVEVALTFTIAGGLARGLSTLNMLQSVTARQVFTRSALLNLTSATAIEPAIGFGQRYFQEERTTEDIFSSIAASAIMGTMLDMGTYGISRLLKGRQIEEDLTRSMMASELGKKPSSFNDAPTMTDLTVQSRSDLLNPSRDMVVYEGNDFKRIGYDGWDGPDSGPTGPRDGGGRSRTFSERRSLDSFQYNYAPISGGGRGASFFTMVSNSGPIREGRTPLISLMFDRGIQLSDNPRNAAEFARTNAGGVTSVGNLREVRLNDANLVDADLPYQYQTPSARKLMDSLGRSADPDMTLSQALKDVSLSDGAKIQDNLLRIMKEENIDGFYFADGDSTNRGNSIFLRDETKFTEEANYQVYEQPSNANKDKFKKYAEDIASEKSDYYYSEETAARYEEASVDLKQDFEPMHKDVVADIDPEFESFKSREDLPNRVKKEIEEADQLALEADEIDKAIKAGLFCGGRG